MDGFLILTILSCVILRVHSNCDLAVCNEEVDEHINNPSFCNITSIQTQAVTSARNCLFDESDTQVCPENVRMGTPEMAQRIQDSLTACGLQQGRVDCVGPDYFLCISGLGGFIFVANSFKLEDLTGSCTYLAQLLTTANLCKSCIGNFFGTAWTNVQMDVEKIWQITENMINVVCDCTAKLKDRIDRIDTSSTCKYIQGASKAASTAARDCALAGFNNLQPIVVFDWVAITNNYIQTVLTWTSNACFFVGGGAGVAVISISAITLATVTHLMRNL